MNKALNLGMIYLAMFYGLTGLVGCYAMPSEMWRVPIIWLIEIVAFVYGSYVAGANV